MSSVKRTEHEIDMTSGPLISKMLLFAFPLMFSSILQLMFNAADIIVVGRFAGDDSLAAVGSNGALINLMINLFTGVSVGVNVLAARYFGARDQRRMARNIHTAIMFSLISGVFLTILGFFLAEPMLRLMRSPDSVRPLAAVYLKIYFLGMPGFMLYNFGAAVLRGKGDTGRPLAFLTAAGVLNVILNLFFVIELHLDTAGVAMATTISQYLSAALIWICLTREQGAFRLRVKALGIDREEMLAMLKIGLPASLNGVLFSISNVIIQSSINSFGAATVAGTSAAGNISGFVYMSMNAFYQAAISFTSQNVGAGRYTRIKRIFWCSQGCVTVTGILLGAAAYVFAVPLLHIYTGSDVVVAQGIIYLAYLCLPYFLCGEMDVMTGILRGLGYSLSPTVITLLGVCGLRLLILATVFRVPAFHTAALVYATYPMSWIVTLAAQLVLYSIVRRKYIKPLAEEEERRLAEA